MKDWLLYTAFATAATLAIHFAGLSWGLSAFAGLVGWPLIGLLVTFDDDIPGGWSNPNGTETPPWRTASYWGQISMGLSISAFVAAIDVGFRTPTGIGFVAASLFIGIIAVTLLRRPLE